MKKIALFSLGWIFWSSCGPTDPKEMANAYCECLKKNLQESDKQECVELARTHHDQLANDPDKQKKYADELVKCTNVGQ